ncbi:MAG: NAD-dependent epimerase/dehydratase family protein [Acidobacteriota bacterium]
MSDDRTARDRALDASPGPDQAAPDRTADPTASKSTSAQRLRVCVTGGAGFIGSHLVDAFLSRGDEVFVIDDLSTGHAAQVADGATLHTLDIQSDAAADLIEESGLDVLVHQAAQIDVRKSVADPRHDAEVNILGSLNVAQAAQRGGARQVLFASTGGAIYGEQETFPADEDHPTRPVSPYGVAKLAVERYLYYIHQSSGLDVACLRYANVYGERQNPHGEAGVVAIFLNRLLAGETPTINGDGGQTRDYVHVQDVVAANLAAVGAPGFHIFNVGTGVETSVVELYTGLASALDLERAAQHGPAKPGEQRRSCVDPARLQRDLGVNLPLDLERGLERTAAWFARRTAT